MSPGESESTEQELTPFPHTLLDSIEFSVMTAVEIAEGKGDEESIKHLSTSFLNVITGARNLLAWASENGADLGSAGSEVRIILSVIRGIGKSDFRRVNYAQTYYTQIGVDVNRAFEMYRIAHLNLFERLTNKDDPVPADIELCIYEFGAGMYEILNLVDFAVSKLPDRKFYEKFSEEMETIRKFRVGTVWEYYQKIMNSVEFST